MDMDEVPCGFSWRSGELHHPVLVGANIKGKDPGKQSADTASSVTGRIKNSTQRRHTSAL
jgi:hypothetical protein